MGRVRIVGCEWECELAILGRASEGGGGDFVHGVCDSAPSRGIMGFLFYGCAYHGFCSAMNRWTLFGSYLYCDMRRV